MFLGKTHLTGENTQNFAIFQLPETQAFTFWGFSDAFWKLNFELPKVELLPCKTLTFGMQKWNFSNAIWNIVRLFMQVWGWIYIKPTTICKTLIFQFRDFCAQIVKHSALKPKIFKLKRRRNVNVFNACKTFSREVAVGSVFVELLPKTADRWTGKVTTCQFFQPDVADFCRWHVVCCSLVGQRCHSITNLIT